MMEGSFIDYVSKNLEITIPIVVFLGYITASVQKIVRLAYYKVDIVYLFSLHVSEVFLGVCYLLLLLTPIYSAFLYHYDTHYFWFSCAVCAIALLIGQVYSLKLKVTKNMKRVIGVCFLYFASMLLLFCHCVSSFELIVKELSIKDFMLYFLVAFLMFNMAVIILQFMAEHSNERFTYLKINDEEVYIIVTVFRENFITVRSKISVINGTDNYKIEIYRGDVVLYPINSYKIYVQFVEEKALL